MKKIFLLLAISTALFSCDKDKNKESFFKSADIQLKDGKAWTWVKLSKDNAPEQLGITIDDAAMNSVPVGTGAGDPTPSISLMLSLPEKALAVTPFKFAMLDWNPNGHEPVGIFGLPHFDFHFYMTSKDEVMNYMDTNKMDHNLPDAAYIPANHIPGPGVPMMGKHWVDVTSPEFNGQTFTQTFIYGSYDSKIVFYEPMITRAFLKSSGDFERAIPQPAKFATSGYYPTKLKVKKHDGVTEIILDEFVKRQAS